MRSAESRFWAKVQKTDGCWLWTACVVRRYGQFGVSSGVRMRAHRYSWELVHGAVPDGLWVLHRCDNPLCVNPEHLFLGDVGVNSRDMVAKGRSGMQQKTHCPKGHEYTEANTIRRSGYRRGRECRTCVNAAHRALGHRLRRERGISARRFA
jgi:hypothetical protein